MSANTTESPVWQLQAGQAGITGHCGLAEGEKLLPATKAAMNPQGESTDQPTPDMLLF